MDFYKVLIKKSAEKELYKISAPYFKHIVRKIQSLSKNPRPHGIDMLTGEEKYFRVRQGDYRIIYNVDDALTQVMIIKIGHRREVYDR